MPGLYPTFQSVFAAPPPVIVATPATEPTQDTPEVAPQTPTITTNQAQPAFITPPRTPHLVAAYSPPESPSVGSDSSTLDSESPLFSSVDEDGDIDYGDEDSDEDTYDYDNIDNESQIVRDGSSEEYDGDDESEERVMGVDDSPAQVRELATIALIFFDPPLSTADADAMLTANLQSQSDETFSSEESMFAEGPGSVQSNGTKVDDNEETEETAVFPPPSLPPPTIFLFPRLSPDDKSKRPERRARLLPYDNQDRSSRRRYALNGCNSSS